MTKAEDLRELARDLERGKHTSVVVQDAIDALYAAASMIEAVQNLAYGPSRHLLSIYALDRTNEEDSLALTPMYVDRNALLAIVGEKEQS